MEQKHDVEIEGPKGNTVSKCEYGKGRKGYLGKRR